MLEKKQVPKKMTTLTEKEIQERLYGFYHKTDMVGEPKPKHAASPEAPAPIPALEPPAAVTTAPPAELFSRVETQSPTVRESQAKTSGLTARLSPERNFTDVPKVNAVEWMDKGRELAQSAGSFLKKIRPQYLIAAGGVLVGLVIIFQLIAFGVKKIQSLPPESVPAHEQNNSEEKEPVRRVIQKAVTPAASVSERSAAEPTNPPSVNPPGTSAAKAYTIQLCLSDNLQASEGLIQTLKGKGYEAYYRKIRGSRGNDLYQIFVGRYPSSSEAQNVLKRLRQDEAFKNYDDSFVRVTS
jgi:cell division septation protein DedD